MVKYLGFLIVFILLILIFVVLIVLVKAMVNQATEKILGFMLVHLY